MRYKINKKKCVGCGQCQEICPENAIECIEDVNKEK